MLKNRPTPQRLQHKVCLHRQIQPLVKNICRTPQLSKRKQYMIDSEQKQNNKLTQMGEKPRIVQISQLVNKNVCSKKQIYLQDITNNIGGSRKKKLEVSLSKQKSDRQRSVSERSTNRSANKSMKLKLSLNKSNSIRKIKCFEVEENNEVQHIKTPRMIQNLNECKQEKSNMNIKNVINIRVGYEKENEACVEKRKIKIYRHR